MRMADNNTVSSATLESFWTILNNNKIVIPRMQRDYAQGREKDQTAIRIRNEFIREIFDTLIRFSKDSTENPLDLGFIYGNIDEGKNEFYPIDGQQRLTTMFLLYWYLASYKSHGALPDEIKSILTKFKYQSRDISGSFCEQLVCSVDIDVTSSNEISENIKDYYWFYGDYETDPTVNSMLVMIDKIDSVAKGLASENNNIEELIDLLMKDPQDCPVRFLFQDLQDLGMTDSIYIKMNARGKPLTPFENFKAQLLTYLNNGKPQFGDDFIDLVNGKWSNLFWKCCNKDAEKMDKSMMKLFLFLMRIEFIVNSTELIGSQTGTKDLNVRVINSSLEAEDDYTFVDHLFADEFKNIKIVKNEKKYEFASDHPIVSVDLFEKIKKLLNCICLANAGNETIDFSFIDSSEFNKTYLNEAESFLRLIGASSKSATSTDEIKLVAYFSFLVKYADDDSYTFSKQKELNKWMRYVHNLAANTENSSKEHYCYAINNICKKLDELNEDATNILEIIADDSIIAADNSGFQKEQAKEECVKARLLLDNYNQWIGLISEAEKTNLDGEIQCLLEFSNIEDNYSADRFALYSRKMRALFGNDLNNTIDPNILRALLSVNLASNNVDDNKIFLFTKRTNFNFWSNTIKSIGDESDFKRFLRNDNSKKRDTLKTLLDQLSDSVDNSTALGEIEKVISKNMQIAEQYSDTIRYKWISVLIRYPSILASLEVDDKKATSDTIFRNPYRYIRVHTVVDPANEENKYETVYLLERTVLNSRHRELYTLELYLKAKENNLKVICEPETTSDTPNRIMFTDINDHTIQVTYEWYSNGQSAYLAKDIDQLGDELFSDNITKNYMGNTVDTAINYISQHIKND